MKTRKELMQQLNDLLGTNHNFNRINLLDLQRIVLALQKMLAKIYVIQNEQYIKYMKNEKPIPRNKA